MVVYTVKQIQGGQWAICRMGFALFKDMQLGPAIELARTVARDEYTRSRRPVSIEMHDANAVIPLGSYDRANAPARSVAS